MKKLSINPLAIVAGVIAAQVIPVIWYGALAQPWLQLSGLTEDQTNAGGSIPYITSIVASALSTTFMAYLFRELRVESAGRGALLGAGLGFFYSFLNILTINGFELRPVGLSVIDGIMTVLVAGAAGALLGGWRKYAAVDVQHASGVTV